MKIQTQSVFGTPWIIEVTHQREVMHAEEAHGWGASRDQIERRAAAISAGELPPGVLKRVKQKATEKARRSPRGKAKPKASAKPKTQVKARARAAVKPTTEVNPGVQDTLRPSPGTQDTPQDSVG